MNRILFALREIFPAVVVLLPVFLLLNGIRFRNGKRTALYFLLSCYLAAVYALVGLPNVTYIRLELNLNLVPFADMLQDLENSILNVLLFVPLGLLVPVLWKPYRQKGRMLLFGLGLSLGIELLQIFTLRATDINDLITNVLGTFLGFGLARGLIKKVPAARDMGKRGRTGELYLVCTITFGVMFFVQPLLYGLL